MRALFLIPPSLKISQSNLRSDRDGTMSAWSLVGTVLARRYKILERLDARSFRAHDLALDQTVTVRQANLTSERHRDTWRARVRQLASVRHPNFLNVLDLVLDGSRDLVVTERPQGHSIAEFLKERNFELEDIVRLVPLTALDLAAAYVSPPNSISARLLFVETRRPQDEQVDLKRRSIFDWPPIVIKLDVWELAKPGRNLTWSILNSKRQESGSAGWAVRQMAQLTYELLGDEKKNGCAFDRRFRPVNALGDVGNSILYNGLQRPFLFESAESFFHRLESAIRPGDGASRALPAPVSKSQEHFGTAFTKNIIRRFNRELTTLAVSAAVCAALVFMFLVQDSHPEAADLPDLERQAEGDLILHTYSPFDAARPDQKKFTGLTPAKWYRLAGPYSALFGLEASRGADGAAQMRSEQSTSVDHGLASTPNPETNQSLPQANGRSLYPSHRQDSTRTAKIKKSNAKSKSSVGLTTAEVKMRLIALWHQSLIRNENARSAPLSNSNNSGKKKASNNADPDQRRLGKESFERP
jgi:hypothetical protein